MISSEADALAGTDVLYLLTHAATNGLRPSTAAGQPGTRAILGVQAAALCALSAATHASARNAAALVSGGCVSSPTRANSQLLNPPPPPLAVLGASPPCLSSSPTRCAPSARSSRQPLTARARCSAHSPPRSNSRRCRRRRHRRRPPPASNCRAQRAERAGRNSLGQGRGWAPSPARAGAVPTSRWTCRRWPCSARTSRCTPRTAVRSRARSSWRWGRDTCSARAQSAPARAPSAQARWARAWARAARAG
ncbi:hypothetical protein T492DRAFT_13896 [Pavlovales sp. CCMP2436]|nr:hypothetical protein T492DRAFT_13896 [Pavlovales sp. CCMP2436]